MTDDMSHAALLAQNYAVALQQAIEAHCRGESVPIEVATRCPHHAKKLDANLAAADMPAVSGSDVPARPTSPAGDAGAEPVIVMTGYQLRAAAEFVNPDAGDTDQLESEVCIQWGPERDDGDGGKEPAGLRVWLADYPEEGSMALDPDKPWPPEDAASPPLPQEQGARMLTDDEVGDAFDVPWDDHDPYPKWMDRMHAVLHKFCEVNGIALAPPVADHRQAQMGETK